MGNISLSNDKNYIDFQNKNQLYNNKNIINNNPYNMTQNGSHSIGISNKIVNNKLNKKTYSDREKENSVKVSKDFRNSSREYINQKIFRMIFPPPNKNSCYLRRSCRDTTKLRLTKEEKKNFHTNIMTSNFHFNEMFEENIRYCK